MLMICLYTSQSLLRLVFYNCNVILIAFHCGLITIMTFNEAKCKCMLLTNKKDTVFPTITLNDHPLEQVHQIKYLGVTFSQNLSGPHTSRPYARKLEESLAYFTDSFVLQAFTLHLS